MNTRRGFLCSLLAVGIAPAIVRADSLMRLRPALPVAPRGMNSVCIAGLWEPTVEELDFSFANGAAEDLYKRLGEAIAEQLYITANREGFMRRYMRLTAEHEQAVAKANGATREEVKALGFPYAGRPTPLRIS